MNKEVVREMNHREKTGVDGKEEKMRPATAATEIVQKLCFFFLS